MINIREIRGIYVPRKNQLYGSTQEDHTIAINNSHDGHSNVETSLQPDHTFFLTMDQDSWI